MNEFQHFMDIHGLRTQDVIFVRYGSRVYGTDSDKSDYDYLAIVPNDSKADTGTEFYKNDTNIHVFNRGDFQQQLNDHKIHALEAYYLPVPDEDDPCVKNQFHFQLDLGKLRESISEKASHSFVKAKKKIEVEKDYYIGWKSLFHSLRILNFGTQIATVGSIENYSAANQYWFDILHAQQYNWEYFKHRYQSIYNKLSTQFKLVAPKKDCVSKNKN